jgi:uncharacterized membrane protein YcaP (DUF421 family)
MDWQSLFAVNVPPFEIFVRGTLIYWFLFGVFRFVLHRDVGGLGIADLLLLVLVADAAQNAMAGDYQSISEGLILVTTIIGWNTLLDLMAYHFPLIAQFAEPRKLCVVRHGRVLRKSLRQELLTTEDGDDEAARARDRRTCAGQARLHGK